MPAPLMHAKSTPSLPQEADDVVIGGGVVACSRHIISRAAALTSCKIVEGRPRSGKPQEKCLHA
jgi:hypothetical protein